MTPNISVLMSAHNSERFIAKSIESILAQTCGDFEFIIIDDFSSDSTPAIIRGFNDNRIVFVQNESNLGLTKSLNKGLAMARGKIIARIDADDLSNKDRFEKQLDFLIRNNVQLVGSSINIIDENDTITKSKRRPELHEAILFYMYTNNPMVHSSAMMEKKALDDIGHYDPTYKYAQDYELWCRFGQKYRMYNIQEPLVSWRNVHKNITNMHNSEQGQFGSKICYDFFRSSLGLVKVEDATLRRLRLLNLGGVKAEELEVMDNIVKAMMWKFQFTPEAQSWATKYTDIASKFRR